MGKENLERLIGSQPIPPQEAREYIYELERQSESRADFVWAMVKIFALGKVYGIRQERSRRRKG